MRSLTAAKDLKGKTVLLRTDLNVEGITDSFKLERSLLTIHYLRARSAVLAKEVLL